MKQNHTIIILAFAAAITAYGINYFIDSKNSSLIQDRLIAGPISGTTTKKTDPETLTPIDTSRTNTTDTTNKTTTTKRTSTYKKPTAQQPATYHLPKLNATEHDTEKNGLNPYNNTRQLSGVKTEIVKNKTPFENTLKKRLKKDEKSQINDNNGTKNKITRDAKISVTLTFEEAEKTTRELIAINPNLDNEIIITPASDSDSDGLSDLIESDYGTDFTNPDSDNDGIGDGAEVLDFNTDPLKTSIINQTPHINNLNNTITGSQPLLKGNAKPEEKIIVVAQKLGSDEKITVCQTEADKSGKFFCMPDKELEDGDYYIYSDHKLETGKKTDDREVVRIKIDRAKALESPLAEIKQIPNMTEVLMDTQKFLNLLTKLLGKQITENYFRKPAENRLSETSQVTKLVGKAKPGEIIVATWKSVILSSTVIADASQGAFEFLIPAELSFGQHDILVYSYSPKLNFISNITKLAFFR